MRRKRAKQLFAVVREVYDPQSSQDDMIERVKERVVGFGWEVILINLAIAIASKLIAAWIERRLNRAPEKMPVGWAVELDETT